MSDMTKMEHLHKQLNDNTRKTNAVREKYSRLKALRQNKHHADLDSIRNQLRALDEQRREAKLAYQKRINEFDDIERSLHHAMADLNHAYDLGDVQMTGERALEFQQLQNERSLLFSEYRQAGGDPAVFGLIVGKEASHE